MCKGAAVSEETCCGGEVAALLSTVSHSMCCLSLSWSWTRVYHNC